MRMIVFILTCLVISPPTWANDDCSGDVRSSKQECDQAIKSQDSANNRLGQQGQQEAAADGGDCGGGNNQGNKAGQGKNNLAKAMPQCEAAAGKCEKACKDAYKRNNDLFQQTKQPQYQTNAMKALQNLPQCKGVQQPSIAQAGSAGQNLGDGSTGGFNQAGKTCGEKQDGQPPKMEPPKGDDKKDEPKKAEDTPKPTDLTKPAGETDVAETGYDTLNDDGKNARYISSAVAPLAPAVAAASGSGGSNSGNLSGAGPSSLGGGAVSGGSGGGLGSSSGMRPTSLNGVLSGGANEGNLFRASRNDVDGAGGGGAGGMGVSSADLADYLPGGKKDPTKKKAGGNESKNSRSAEIASKHSNLFGQITARFQTHCKLKTLIGCK